MQTLTGPPRSQPRPGLCKQSVNTSKRLVLKTATVYPVIRHMGFHVQRSRGLHSDKRCQTERHCHVMRPGCTACSVNEDAAVEAQRQSRAVQLQLTLGHASAEAFTSCSLEAVHHVKGQNEPERVVSNSVPATCYALEILKYFDKTEVQAMEIQLQ